MGELRCARSVCLPFVLSAAGHSVRRHAGHVMERPRLGFPFATSAAAQVNYSCVQIGHAILRRHRITGAVQSGNSVTHSVADATRNWCFDSGREVERELLTGRVVEESFCPSSIWDPDPGPGGNGMLAACLRRMYSRTRYFAVTSPLVLNN
jgi:hypothetical protein